jgi:threonyl-tRNA synthetase
MENSQFDHLRHSAAHLLAAAVMELWPDTKKTIGPAIENGFYFDFEFAKPISENDFVQIEQKMKEIVKSWDSFEKIDISAIDAIQKYKDNPYKLELIDEIVAKGEPLTLYKSGNYDDLCRGGHVEIPKQELKNFKLLSLAGAYWRGNEKNPMLTRIYGTIFPTKEELDQYLIQLEEAKKRDHKKLGPQLELFMFHETAPGMPYWLPNGVILYNELLAFWREEHRKRNYLETMSPMVNKKDLYITSGHYDHYWEDMFHFTTPDEEEYALKAMNCPNAMVIFGSKTRSYKDLPLRISDTDSLHRFERSGTLNGLLRVREFRQDDAHNFITEDQIKDEYKSIFEITERFYSIFNMKYSYRLGTRPKKYMGDIETWNKAEKALKEILHETVGENFTIAEEDGAFYGPKIDILMKDSIGRNWQMGTIQLDFQQPQNFKLKYTDSDGSEKTPVAVHRVIYGSMERFIGILIEHYAGAFPTWLSPVQVVILPVAEAYNEYSQKVAIQLQNENVRAEVNLENKTLGAKIRESTLKKIPFMVIIGDKEKSVSEKEMHISVRTREGQNQDLIKLSDFVTQLKKQIVEKK